MKAKQLHVSVPGSKFWCRESKGQRVLARQDGPWSVRIPAHRKYYNPKY